MWFLISNSDERVIYLNSKSKEVIIGRKADNEICNFAIPDDSSISRKHASLSLSDNCLILQDLGSKYGTFLNESDKLEPNNKVTLNPADIVRFGKMGCIWKVCKENFITCTSTLKGENLSNLKLILNKIGGNLSNEWDEHCRFLTMPAITLTIKVVLALVQGSHIVTTEFWNKCLEAVNSNIKLPNPSDFIPNIIESTLNKENVSFLPNVQRKKLFTDKKIIFFSRRQFEMYKTVLLNSSALPLLLSESKMTKNMLCEQDVIVIQYNQTNTSQESQAQRNQINEIINFLKGKGKRIIADAEIGLAILYCSLHKYCNPDFSFSSEVIKQNTVQSKTPNILVPETQETEKLKMENVIINESLMSNDALTTNLATNVDRSNKRKVIEDETVPTSAAKKLSLDHIAKSNESSKRKLTEDSDSVISNPAKKIAMDNENSNDEEIFNFKASTDLKCLNNSDKKLNLSKPLKRRADVPSNEDDLFNFVENADNTKKFKDEEPKNIICDDSEININKICNSNVLPNNMTLDISAMRGVKLNELINNDQIVYSKPIVKKETLEEKMNHLDLGMTIVTVKSNLIVKKEPVQLEAQSSQQTNFKKFKKVWPVKMQVTIIPRSSMCIVTTGSEDITSMS